MKRFFVAILSLLFLGSFAVAQVFTPGDTVIGGQIVGNNFEVGTAGFLGGENNWPFGEPPENAIDGTSGKYLNFGEQNTGLIVTPSVGSSLAQNLTVWTANDALERDPVNYEIYGTNANVSGAGPFPVADFDLISSGPLALPGGRNPVDLPLNDANSTSVPFLNSTSYTTYMIIFPEVTNPDTANSMQIAEVQLNVGPPTLTLIVNTLTGNASLENNSGSDIDLSTYQIESAGGSLSLAGWNSLQDNPSFPAVSSPGAGDGWEVGGGSSATRLVEGYLLGSSAITAGQTISLGSIYDTGVGAEDLTLEIAGPNGNPVLGLVDYVSDGLTCDFNGSSICDIVDIDLLYAQLGSSNPQFDLDGNGTVGPEDITEWLAQASAADTMGRTFKPGDTDLNGSVEGGDFTALALNFGVAPATWGQGNFDGSMDGVGGSDFTSLALNFGFTSVSAVPEPTSFGMLLLSGCLGLWCCRRQLG